MPIAFPTSLDALNNPTAYDQTDSVSVPHATQHENTNDAVEALEAKVGVNNSAVTSSLDYRTARVEEILTGDAGAPSSTPTRSFALYLDTNTGQLYAWYSSSWH